MAALDGAKYCKLDYYKRRSLNHDRHIPQRREVFNKNVLNKIDHVIMGEMYANCSFCFLCYANDFCAFPPAGIALASGLAATVTITHMLKSGDGIVCMDDVYGGEALLTTPCNLHNGVEKQIMHYSHVQNGCGNVFIFNSNCFFCF